MFAMAFSDHFVLKVLEKHSGKNLTQGEIKDNLDMELSLRTIQRCIVRLETSGHIEVDRRHGSIHGSVYRVVK